MGGMARRTAAWKLFAVAASFVLCCANGATAQVRVGAARVSVTPGAGDLPYAPSDTPSLNLATGERSFVGVHDEIFARAIVADDGKRRFALVVLDVTTVPASDEIARAVADAIGARPSDVLLLATHTHNVPLFSYAGARPSDREKREIDRLKRGAVAAALGAAANLAPVKITFARTEAWVNVNNGEQSGSRAGYDMRGPSDKSLDIVRFETLAGKPVALLLNYSSHAEVMFRSITKDGGYEISGDLPGAVARMLETSVEGNPVTLFTAGAEADQLTLFKSLSSGGRLGPVDQGAAGWSLLDVQARRVADAAIGALAAMPAGEPLGRVDVSSGSTICPGQQLKIDPVTKMVTTEPKPGVVIPLAAVRLNDIVLAGVGGDVATEIGERFKAASPGKKTFMMTMMGPSVGYIFADASYVHPGHGLTKSLLAPGCAGPAIVGSLDKMIAAGRAR